MNNNKTDLNPLISHSINELPKERVLFPFFLQCPIHNKFPIIKVCRLCYQKNHFILCEKCLSLKEPVSHQDHSKYLIDLEKYVDECRNNWTKIQSEEKEAKEMFSKLEEFLLEAGQEETILQNFIDEEIDKINQDYMILMKKLDEIKDKINITKIKFIKTLTDEMKEMRKLKEDLNAFAVEGSPLFRKKSIGNMEESMNKLMILVSDKEKQKEKDFIVETFGTLIKEFKKFELNFELNYKKDYIEEINRDFNEKEISKREASLQILNIMNEIRNKSKYPPKYKQFQNSKEVFDNFLKGLDKVLEDVQEMAEKLLLTQQDVTYKLTGENLSGKVNFASNNISLLLKSEESTRMPQTFEIATSIKTDHRKGITCLCVYDQQSFITGGNDSLIKIWDIYTFKCAKNLKCETVPYSIITMIDANGEKILISGHAQGYVAVFNKDFDLRFVFKKQESIISALISIDDRKTVFSASYDATILIIDIVEGRVLKKLTAHEASVNCLGYSPYLNRCASGSDDGQIMIWEIEKDVSTSKIEDLKEKAPNLDLEEELKGSLDSIESENSDKISENFNKAGENISDNEKLSEISNSFRDVQNVGSLRNGEEVKHIVFSQNNPRILISTCYNLIKVWDIVTKSCLLKFGKHEKNINRILIMEEKILQKNIEKNLKRARADSLSSGFLGKGNNLLELMSIDTLMILSFGVDHMIRLWSASKNICVCESHDHIKEFSLKDSLENTILMYNEKDDKGYFLSVGDKDNIINVWKLK